MSSLTPYLARTRIAYFTMEIGLRSELHTYSGGLGILAGDSARAAADLDLPMVFVSVVSRRGYLRQEIDGSGQQIDHDDRWNPDEWAELLPPTVTVPIEGRAVAVRAWLYRLASPAGHSLPVILLDTNCPGNGPDDAAITDQLYGGDQTLRLKQEIVLGIGGEAMLRALGFKITTFHMNEGHAALLTLSLLKRAADGQRDGWDGAARRAHEHCVFTTHTPVEAGHDRFDYGLLERVLGPLVPFDVVRRFGGSDQLNMTRLALNLSGFVNGVAKKHAETTAHMFPGYHIEAITNGVHTATWTHRAFADLYDTISHGWAIEPERLLHADELDDDALWAARREAKSDLIATVTARCGKTLDPNLPIIVYARRMTGYKRPELLFSRPDELRRIFRKTPFQVVMSGKAHPRDFGGKALIAEIHKRMAELSDEIPMAFIPNYEMALAKRLVAGADLWLNTPLPPLEASGTSGMKAALNGGLNLSSLDGWWLEGCIEGVTGWGFNGANNTSPEQNADDLYAKLGDVVLPLYHNDRGRWAYMMKQSISKIGPFFSTERMMRRYLAAAYDHGRSERSLERYAGRRIDLLSPVDALL